MPERFRIHVLVTFFAFGIAFGFGDGAAARETGSVYEGKNIGEFYDRLAKDLKTGKPLVATVYVALCDNDSQSIARTKTPKICMGDYPEQNLYWASSSGLKQHLDSRGWKRVLYEKSDTDKIAARGVWGKRIRAEDALVKRGVKGPIQVYIVGLGYRGTKIHDAMVDYLHAVSRDRAAKLQLEDGTEIEFGGRSQVIGYVGHDYFMDVLYGEQLLSEAVGNSAMHKAVFGLACVSDEYFRPAIQRRNTHILALNTGLTFPSAFTVLGMIQAVVAGKDAKGIHQQAARAFAKGQGRSLGTMLRALSYGDKKIPDQSP